MKEVTRCCLCRSSTLSQIWDLPRFPLTEQFGSYDSTGQYWFDQELLFCTQCGHVQLKWQLTPDKLYTSDDYSFRTSTSESAKRGCEVFLSFLNNLFCSGSYKNAIDIGGNDLYLAKQLKKYPFRKTVIDPVLSASDGEELDGIRVVGRTVESVDLSQELGSIDLILCRHTLEHVSDPVSLLRQLFFQTEPNCLFVFEVPCLEGLLESLRFDAVFHQHYHYFTLNSFKVLLKEAGGELVDFKFNWKGSCGGALLVAFRRRKDVDSVDTFLPPSLESNLRRLVTHYKTQMTLMADLIHHFAKPIYGYGASLMLATLAYHLKTDFSNLECVLDDDHSKHGSGYKNLPVRVKHTSECDLVSDAFFVITSLENVRQIASRVSLMSPRRVLVPFII